MTAPPDDAAADADPQSIIAVLQQRLDAALSEKAALAEELAARGAASGQRTSAYDERIAHQSATIDVLRVMSASPGDPQPVFDLIVHHANALCDGSGVGLFEFDGTLVYLRANVFGDAGEVEIINYRAMFPMVPSRGSVSCRAILDKQIIHIKDYQNDLEVHPTVRAMGYQSQLSIPLMREGTAIGVISLGGPLGGFTDSQIALLQTFAEQAVIAITRAETYRALQTPTSDLQEALEYQTAISDVLKVISNSNFALEPVFQTVVDTAVRLCRADQAGIFRLEGDAFRWVAGTGLLPEFERRVRTAVIRPGTGTLIGRVALQGRPVQIVDEWTDPLYVSQEMARIGGVHTSLGVPLVWDGVTIGAIGMARLRIEPFTDRQIELVSTFANQAVIAIENTRLMTEQREALEQQTATAEVLGVINASPGNLVPVFDAILDNAHTLCDAALGSLVLYDGTHFRAAATHGYPDQYDTVVRQPQFPTRRTQPLLNGQQFVHVLDIKADQDEPDSEVARTRLGHTDIRTALWMPLRKDAQLLGFISAFRTEVRAFTNGQIALLESFAAQAVIAIENARLLNEQREALEQQTATAEVLQVINASPGDLTPVFEAMLEKAMRLCGAAIGGIYRYNGRGFDTVALLGVTPAFQEYNDKYPLLEVRPGSLPSRIIETKGPVQNPDVMASEQYRAGIPYARALAELGGIRAVLDVPLLKEGALLGFIAIYREEAGAFSDKQVALLENFAAQAVIAMENARLLNEQREALERQTAMAEVLQVINASPGDLMPVFDTILEKAMRLCGAAIGGIYGYDGQWFHPVALRGVTPAFAAFSAEHSVPSWPSSAPMRILKTKRPAQVPDLADGSDYTRGMVELGGIRALLDVPLLKEDALLGFIAIYREEAGVFSDKQVTLLENFAAQAVIAMENARLLTEQREALERQTATSEVLQVINANPGNLAPVFDAMLEKAHGLCGVTVGSLTTYDGEYLRAVATRGYSGQRDAMMRQHRHPNVYEQALIHGDRLVHISGAKAIDPTQDQGAAHNIAASMDVRTGLLVPLRKDDTLLGLISAYRLIVRPFSDKEIALLENFAAQAVIAMENARLLTEQREALEQQTATADVLRVINGSPGDLTPVFDAILEKAHKLCGATHGSLTLFDGERFRAVATYGHSEVWAERLREGLPAVDNPGTEPLLDGARFVHIADMTDIDHSLARAAAEATGVRTALFVPLRKDNRLIGAISAHRREVRSFTEKEIALLENFAAQAVIAMENARLITEQREALEQQTATAEVLQVINASPGNLAPVFDATLEKALRLCESAFGGLHTYDGERISTPATRGMPERLVEFLRHPIRPVPGMGFYRIIQGEDVVHTPDLTDEEVYRSGNPARVALADLGGARTQLLVALRKDNALLGMINVFRQEVRPFSDRQITLLQNFAAQAVIAMENARLLDEIRQRQEELRVTFENMGDGVALFDEAARLVAWNRHFQEMFNLPDNLLEQHHTYEEHLRFLAARGDFGSGRDTEEQLRALVASTDKPSVYERTRPDGRVLEIRRNPVPDGGFVLIFSDITERKRSEAEIRAARDAAETAYRDLKAAQANLIQAEKMASLGQLTAGIAHEIKNPLNFVNNFAELSGDLLDELNDAVAGNRQAEIDELRTTLQGNLAKITEHGRRADAIVRSMLEHSRGSSGERRMVDLNALIDKALNLAYHGARAQDQNFNITLERDFGEGIAPIELAPQDMTRVFLNLFSNGFYAAHQRQQTEGIPGFEPTLKVTTRELGRSVEIRVRDNGSGIPTEIKDKLFQPFFTTKPTGEGTGLGLSISYDIIVNQHRGQVTVDSRANEFTDFVVTLPRELSVNRGIGA